MLHEAVAYLITHPDIDPVKLIGFVHEGHTLTKELFDELLMPALNRFGILQAGYGPFPFEVEQRVGSCIKDGWGTADVIGWNNEHIIMIDWKFGRGVYVKTEENKQALFYASGARPTEKWAHLFESDRKIVISIIQPAFDVEPAWETTIDRLVRFDLELMAAMKLAEQEEPVYHDGDHCRFCPAKVICPLLNNEIMTFTAELGPRDADKLGELMTRIVLIKPWMAAIEKDAHKIATSGQAIPGFKLVPKRGTRKWDADEDVIAHNLKLLEVNPYSKKILSPAQAEKALKTSLPDGWVKTVSSGTKLVPEADAQKAVPDIATSVKALARKLKHV